MNYFFFHLFVAYREEDAEKAALEAEEALAIQKSVYNCIKTDNYVEAYVSILKLSNNINTKKITIHNKFLLSMYL